MRKKSFPASSKRYEPSGKLSVVVADLTLLILRYLMTEDLKQRDSHSLKGTYKDVKHSPDLQESKETVRQTKHLTSKSIKSD